jgi:hypothetical protein
MRPRYLLLLAVVALAAAGYVGFWFFAAGQVRDGIDGWAAFHRARGVEVSYGAPAISGFPYRLIVEVAEPRLALPLHPLQPAWSAPRLAAVAHPWNVREVLIDLAGRHALGFTQRALRRDLDLQVPEGRAGYRADSDGRLALLSIDLHRPSLREPATGLAAAAQRLQLHLRPGQAPDVNLEVAGSAEQVSAEGLGPLPFGPVIGKLAVEAELRGLLDGPSPAAAAAAWRDAGGTIEIRRFVLVWGDLQIEGTGTLALDDRMRPVGAGAARVRGQEAVIDLAVADGQMSAGAGNLAKATLGALAAANGGVLSVPFRMQEGWLFLGPARLARLSPVFPDAVRSQ